jgi:manganese/zinc/iron transport system substrate-binding protein
VNWRSLCLLSLSLLVGCGSDAPSDGKLHVVATTGMIADAARIIGGDRVRVEALMGPGVDPHLYITSRQDQKRLREAELVLYHGHHLEGKMADALHRLRDNSGEERLVVAVGEAVPAAELFHNEAFAGFPDPHIWFDLMLWRRVVVSIGDALAKRAPEHAVEFETRAKDYLEQLLATHSWAKEQASKVPEGRRRIVTSHDAYSYFAKAYGFEVRGLQGISTDSEPGLRTIRDAVTYIKKHGIPVIFAETSVRSDAVDQVASEAQCRVCEHKLYSDALGELGSSEESFLGVFRYNMTTIVEALSPSPGASSPDAARP